MSSLLVALLGFTAALVQIGPLPLVFVDPLAVPVLPAALIAGWASMRPAHETWGAVVAVAVALGAVSEARIGWFMLALLPTPAVVLLALRLESTPEAPRARRLLVAPLAAAAGAVAYLGLLALSTGDVAGLAEHPGRLAASATWTALFAAAVALALWTSRARPTGLFA